MTKNVLAIAASLVLIMLNIASVNASPAEPLLPTMTAQGVVRVKSLYEVDETVARLKADIAAKGITVFTEIDQSKLSADTKTPIRPSTLILFGNPPLGVQFLASNPYAGLDWPVRMLVLEEADGSVSIVWTDFRYIAKRFGITDREAQFTMASDVAASIASAATK